MVNPRTTALNLTAKRASPLIGKRKEEAPADSFGSHVFTRSVMQKMLPKEVYNNLIQAMRGSAKLCQEYADVVAVAMKEWASNLGATHYSHWFQPLTGASAEKHDSFIEWKSLDQVIEKFSGKQLIQGEPDASSFPSGGLRSTYEARGYTGWDVTSPVFVWSAGDGVTLCIPSVFFSWTGDVLDTKIPLLRSDKAISDASLRLLKLTGIHAEYVNSTLGCEQEYFVIDRAWRNLRPDLVLAGRTVFGALPSKGQELQDHYFGSVKDRILSYMRDFEIAALKLGIPVKTRHNEVAPSQHEMAPVFERSSSAVDHNILLMELMRQTAVKHDLSCLLHEKPFSDINGSGKHCNWSLSTDTGINLLDPTDYPENNIHFLILLTAILNAVHENAALLRASIGSYSNDFRLGGHEAPPAIISVYLGKELEAVLESIEKTGSHTRSIGTKGFDLGIFSGPDLLRDNTDRNRTSPFAFTGNKFEFRAVGSSANPSFPVTVLNVIVAQSLNKIIDEITGHLETSISVKETHNTKTKNKEENLSAIILVLRKYLKASKNIRFGGDNYSDDWLKEAKKRGLPIVKKSIHSFEALKSKKTIEVFKGVLNSEELHSRFDVLTEIYSHHANIEAKLMVDIFKTQILPAAIKQQKEFALSIGAFITAGGKIKKIGFQKELLDSISSDIEDGIKAVNDLEEARKEAFAISDFEKRGKAFCLKVLPKGEVLREIVDRLEGCIDDELWQLPKYREMLFMA